MELLVALIELRVLVVVVGMINLPGERGTLEFFYTLVSLSQKKLLACFRIFPLKTIPFPRRYLCKV